MLQYQEKISKWLAECGNANKRFSDLRYVHLQARQNITNVSCTLYLKRDGGADWIHKTSEHTGQDDREIFI